MKMSENNNRFIKICLNSGLEYELAECLLKSIAMECLECDCILNSPKDNTGIWIKADKDYISMGDIQNKSQYNEDDVITFSRDDVLDIIEDFDNLRLIIELKQSKYSINDNKISFKK